MGVRSSDTLLLEVELLVPPSPPLPPLHHHPSRHPSPPHLLHRHPPLHHWHLCLPPIQPQHLHLPLCLLPLLRLYPSVPLLYILGLLLLFRHPTLLFMWNAMCYGQQI